MKFQFSALWSFLALLAGRILQGIAAGLYIRTWKLIFEGIRQAEQKYREMAKAGSAKRKELIDLVIHEIKDTAAKYGKKLGFVELLVIRLFVEETVAGIIKGLNETFGHDWLKYADQAEDALAAMLPFVTEDSVEPDSAEVIEEAVGG